MDNLFINLFEKRRKALEQTVIAGYSEEALTPRVKFLIHVAAYTGELNDRYKIVEELIKVTGKDWGEEYES